MEYELINMSDPYTFIAEDLEVAALTVFSLSLAYGAKSKDGKETVPIFLFGGGATEWYEENFNKTPDEGLEARKGAVAAALDSMMLGHFEDRKRYQAALDAITDGERREQFIAMWQDGCSSINNIGTYAHKLAKKLMESEEPV